MAAAPTILPGARRHFVNLDRYTWIGASFGRSLLLRPIRDFGDNQETPAAAPDSYAIRRPAKGTFRLKIAFPSRVRIQDCVRRRGEPDGSIHMPVIGLAL